MEAINSEHPEYVASRRMRRKYRDLHLGGETLQANAGEYLVRRQKEPLEVYSERLSRVFYENYIGSIIDWYGATLFRREPLLMIEGADRQSKDFFSEFAEDCDLKGSTLTEFFRRQVVEALVHGSSYILVDFPRWQGGAASRAEEDLRGVARAYLVEYSAEHLINWKLDELGNFEWVVLRSQFLRQEEAGSPWTKETRWQYFDRERYRVYRKREQGQEGVELVDQGVHGLAKQGRVPLISFRLPEGLWLMNKAALLQLEHFNKSNALSWALTMGLFATPVVYSDREWNQIVGESYYIQLGPEDRFGWTEPEGHVFQIAADNLTRLQEEIYRVCYMMTQAGGPLASRQAQSGISKQRDFAITQEVLRAMGDAVKDSMKRVLRAIRDARGEETSIDVSGLDEFDIGDFSSELSDAERLLAMGIKSKTLKKQVLKKLAFKYLCDVRQEVKEQIGREIDDQINGVRSRGK